VTNLKNFSGGKGFPRTGFYSIRRGSDSNIEGQTSSEGGKKSRRGKFNGVALAKVISDNDRNGQEYIPKDKGKGIWIIVR